MPRHRHHARTIDISTYLEASPDCAWQHVTRPDLLHYVSRGVTAFSPIDPSDWPERWEEGEYKAAMKVFGLPMGWQVIGIEYPETRGDVRRMRDNGRGRDIAVWDHMIEVAPEGDGTRYTDRVTIDAGWRTPLVAAFARYLYTHRQKRWRRLVANGFDYGA